MYIIFSINTDSDTDRHCHIVSDINCFDFLQNIKTFFLQFFQRTLTHNKNKFIFFQFLYKTIHFTEIFIQFPFDQGNQQRTSYLFYAVQCFFVVIQIQKSCYQFFIIPLQNIPVHICLIKYIKRCKMIICLRFDQTGIFQHLLNGNSAHRSPIVSLLKVEFYFGRFFFWESFQCDFLKNTGNTLMISRRLSTQIRKSIIHPQHSASSVKKGIRHNKFFQKTLLNLSILRGKRDQLIQYIRSAMAILKNCNTQIDD